MPQIFPKALNPVAKMIMQACRCWPAGRALPGPRFYRSATPPVLGKRRRSQSRSATRTTLVSWGFIANTATPPSDLRLRECPADQDLHELPPANLARLEPARAGAQKNYKKDQPIEWNRVHNLPHYAYFNHSIHVEQGCRVRDLPRSAWDQWMNLTKASKTPC